MASQQPARALAALEAFRGELIILRERRLASVQHSQAFPRLAQRCEG